MSHVTTTVTKKHFVGSHSQVYCSDFHKRLSSDFQSRIGYFISLKHCRGRGRPLADCFQSGPALKWAPRCAYQPTHSYTFCWSCVCSAGRGNHRFLCVGPVVNENQIELGSFL